MKGVELDKKKMYGTTTQKGDEEGDVNKMHVHDLSLDYKGRVPLRASTGSWKASCFIIAIEFSEKVSYFGITTNLITYMTKVMRQDLKTAANSVNIWGGVTAAAPLLGGFLADSYTGGFTMIVFSAILYVLGLGLLTMSQYIPALKPCTICDHVSKTHEVVFFIAIYIVAVATGGYKPCLQSFGADQFDDNNAKERKQKMSFFNWWNICICAGIFVGDTVIVYMQDNVAWGVGFMILGLTMAVSLVVFVLGRPFYRYRAARGSPLTPLLQVIVAAFAKRSLSCPSDPSLLYEVSKSTDKRRLNHTDRLRFFDNAAIIEEDETNGAIRKKEQTSPWRLATVTHVEELKLIINILPIWLSCIVFGVGISQGTTFFIKQGSVMNRRVSKHFEIPPPSLFIMTALGMMVTVALYDKVLLPYLRRCRANERGISLLARLGVGMIILILTTTVAALVERKRQKSALNGHILSAFWLAPQFILMGIGDGFSLGGMQEYFYDQVPDSMRSLGLALYLCVIGVGSFMSTFFIIIVDSISGLNGGKEWIGKDLNGSRLDCYYWFLTVVFVVNMCVYVYLARNYRYKNVHQSVLDADSSEEK